MKSFSYIVKEKNGDRTRLSINENDICGFIIINEQKKECFLLPIEIFDKIVLRCDSRLLMDELIRQKN